MLFIFKHLDLCHFFIFTDFWWVFLFVCLHASMILFLLFSLSRREVIRLSYQSGGDWESVQRRVAQDNKRSVEGGKKAY